MFKEYMTNGGELSPEVQAVMKASADIAKGVFSLQEAAKFYRVSANEVIRFIAESTEYDMIFNKGERK